MREEREEKRERERERKKWFGFENSNLYPTWIFEFSTSFLHSFGRVSIFSNYDAKINFQVTILKLTDQKLKIDFIFTKIFS